WRTLSSLLPYTTLFRSVNLVNAHLVARERGVAVTVTTESETHGYGSLLTVVTQTREGRKIIAGTVFDGQPRIVRLRDLNIEFTRSEEHTSELQSRFDHV